MKWFWCVSLLLLIVSGTAADIAAFRETDPRLEKPVTLDVNHVKLEDVAKSLTEQSGVGIKAGTSSRDWKVRERRVTIHAKDTPLGAMLDEISRLSGFYLSREGKSGEWSYSIWQDLKARMLEGEMLVAAQEARVAQKMKIRQDMLDAMEDALAMTPEEALKLRDKDPLAAYLGGTRPGRGFSQLLSSLRTDFPTDYGLMMRGKSIDIHIDDMPSSLDPALADIMADRYLQVRGQDFAPLRLVVFMADDLFGYRTGGPEGIIAFQVSGGDENEVAMYGPKSVGMIPIIGRDDKFGSRWGRMLLDMEEGPDPSASLQQFETELKDAEKVAGILAKKSPTEENPPTDPKLTREIEILEVPAALSDPTTGVASPEDHGKTIQEIARASGLTVLLESYRTMPHLSAFIKVGKQPFYNVLIAAEKAGCAWELGDHTLRIRPEDWAIYRSLEIPEGWLDRFKQRLEKNGAFTLDDLGEVCADLTDAQIDGTLRDDPDLSYPLMPIFMDPSARKVLRAFGSMTREQKSWLYSEAGLGFGYLTDRQWDGIAGLITDRLGGVQIADGSIRIPADDEGNYGSSFEFTVLSPDEEEPHGFGVSMWIPDKAAVKDMQESPKKEQEEAETPDTGIPPGTAVEAQ